MTITAPEINEVCRSIAIVICCITSFFPSPIAHITTHQEVFQQVAVVASVFADNTGLW